MAPNFSNVPKYLIKTADYLRSTKSELKLRQGVLNGRRADYFKGKSAVNALMRDAFAKTTKRPAFTSTSEAEKELKEMLSCGLFVRVEKNTKRSFAVCKTQDLEMDGYYTWIYEGSQWLKFLTGVAVMLIVFAGVMFPLWPMSMRVGVSYLSYVLLGLLGLLMVIIGLRFVIYIVTVLVFGRAGWLFPRLFEDIGFFESFVPVWKWEEKKKRVKAKEEKDE